MNEKKDATKPKQPKAESPFFEMPKNTNYLTGYPEGKAKPTEITTTHKIGKGWK